MYVALTVQQICFLLSSSRFVPRPPSFPLQSQYALLMDIVNNLLLYKEPRKKVCYPKYTSNHERFEKGDLYSLKVIPRASGVFLSSPPSFPLSPFSVTGGHRAACSDEVHAATLKHRGLPKTCLGKAEQDSTDSGPCQWVRKRALR